MKATEQVSLWDHVRYLNEAQLQKENCIGPFKHDPEKLTHRYFNCRNYNKCLSHAAANLWDYFTCYGCIHTNGKRIK